MNCKCSHSKEVHQKGKLARKYCTVCQCERYIRYDRPNKFDFIALICGLVIIGFMVVYTIIPIMLLSGIPQGELSQRSYLSVGQTNELMYYLAIMTFGFVSYAVLDAFVFPFIMLRRRRDFNNQ